jgi:hypothetical protein
VIEVRPSGAARDCQCCVHLEKHNRTQRMHSAPWKRSLLGVAVCVTAVIGVAPANEAEWVKPMTIHGRFKDRAVMLTATARSAGAIESLQWGGVEFIDTNDHGRDLQSAVVFDGLAECDNPTEAGASKDGSRYPRSTSSRLEFASAAGNELGTYSQMAYWLRPGQRSAVCGQARNEGGSRVSSTKLAKRVRFLPGFDNVFEHAISFELARARSMAQFEVLTAYMPSAFGTFYTFDPATDRLEPLSDGPGEQNLPVVLATSDGSHALGLYTAQQGATPDFSGPGYGRWRFGWQLVTKSNVVFRQKNAAAGPHRFVVYSVFGTLEDVRTSMSRLSKDGAVLAAAARAPAKRDSAARVVTLND